MPCTKAFWKHKQKQSTNKQTKNSRNPVAQSGENLVPWVLLRGKWWQLMGTNLFAWHVNSQGLCVLEEKSPKRRKKLWLFCLEKAVLESRAVLRAAGRPALQPLSSWGRECHAAASSLLPGSHGSIPSYSASDSSPTALPRGIALHYIAFPARRHCCITVQSSSKM